MSIPENTLNFNKREILHEIRLYSLESVLYTCITAIEEKKYLANWIIYLIIKWKFIATDTNRDFAKGRSCNSRILLRWCNLIWKSKSNLENIHHFLRNMFDTQIIWQKNYVLDVFFFPSFIGALREDDPIRLEVLNRYKISIKDFQLIVALLYLFRENSEVATDTAKVLGPDFFRAFNSIIEDLTIDWQKIAGKGLPQGKNHEDSFSKYLANIDLEETTFEGTESPWIEQYPIIAFNNQKIFSIDSLLWQRRLSTYFFEKLSTETANFSDLFGKSFENYCKHIATSNFPNGKIKSDLPKSTPNADFIMEDDDNFYIVEIKHKKYDPKIFSIADAKRLSCQLFNQVVKGYKQVKATAENIDNNRIFKYKRKPLNKRRIGFVVTERSYRIGHGTHFTSLAGLEHKITDTHIKDDDIYFIGIQEFELLLLASRDSGIKLSDVVQASFSERQVFIERRDLVKKFNLKTRTLAEFTKDEFLEGLRQRLASNASESHQWIQESSV